MARQNLKVEQLQLLKENLFRPRAILINRVSRKWMEKIEGVEAEIEETSRWVELTSGIEIIVMKEKDPEKEEKDLEIEEKDLEIGIVIKTRNGNGFSITHIS